MRRSRDGRIILEQLLLEKNASKNLKALVYLYSTWRNLALDFYEQLIHRSRNSTFPRWMKSLETERHHVMPAALRHWNFPYFHKTLHIFLTMSFDQIRGFSQSKSQCACLCMLGNDYIGTQVCAHVNLHIHITYTLTQT